MLEAPTGEAMSGSDSRAAEELERAIRRCKREFKRWCGIAGSSMDPFDWGVARGYERAAIYLQGRARRLRKGTR